MKRDKTELKLPKNVMLAEAETLLLGASRYTQKDYRAVCEAITQFENHSKDAGYGRSEIDDACFFLCTFLDEKVSWDKSLLLTFYKSTAKKDDEFFNRLEERQKNPKKYIDLLELTYFCLSLGFQGKSDKKTPENIISLMDILYSNIRNHRDEAPDRLIAGNQIKRKAYWRCPPIWITGIIALAILVSIFIPYNKKLNQYVTPALDTLQNMTQADNSAHEN